MRSSILKLLYIISIFILPEPSLLIARTPTEYQVKSALIFNFIKFVELDQSKYKNNSITLCSYKGNKINDEVIKLTGLNISGLKIEYNEIEDDENIDNCSILIVDKRDDASLKILLEKAYEKKILTISDNDDFGEKGVVFNMYLQDERVRFEINIEASKRSGVKISSRLLSIAKIVKNIK